MSDVQKTLPSENKATVAKRSLIQFKILSSAVKVEVIFYLAGKIIWGGLTIRRWRMKIFQSWLQAVCFGQTLVSKAIFYPVYQDLSTWQEVEKQRTPGRR